MSAYGPKQTWASAPHMSAFGGKADIGIGSTSLAVGIDGAGSVLATIVFGLINDSSSAHHKRVHLSFESDRILKCEVVPDFPTTSDNRLAIKNRLALDPRHDNPITVPAQIRYCLAFRKSDGLHVRRDRFRRGERRVDREPGRAIGRQKSIALPS